LPLQLLTQPAARQPLHAVLQHRPCSTHIWARPVLSTDIQAVRRWSGMLMGFCLYSSGHHCTAYGLWQPRTSWNSCSGAEDVPFRSKPLAKNTPLGCCWAASQNTTSCHLLAACLCAHASACLLGHPTQFLLQELQQSTCRPPGHVPRTQRHMRAG
jgi:hypothetical protein